MVIDNNLIPFLKEMLAEIKANGLVVSKEKNLDSHSWKDEAGRGIRVATNHPPKWYSELYAMFPKDPSQWKNQPGKVQRSNVSRWKVILILKLMIKNGKSDSIYAPHLLAAAKEKMEYYNSPMEAYDPSKED